MIYQVSSSKVHIELWFASREDAIAAFEGKCKRLGDSGHRCTIRLVSAAIHSNTIASPSRAGCGLRSCAIVMATFS